MNQLLIIGYVWPEPTSSAAGKRMLQLIELFSERDWKITFACPAKESEHCIDFKAYGIIKENITINDSSFDEFLKNLQPEIVIFDRFMMEEQLGWRISENCPNALKILDTEDLHFLRQARQEAVKQNREFATKDLYSDLAKRELASILRCDLSLIISSFEFQLLRDQFNISGAILAYLPLFFENISAKKRRNLSSFSERKDFAFIGNFYHQPNWDAVLQLKVLWPSIKKKLPEASLKIYGAYTPEKAKKLHNEKQGFLVMGKADSVEEVLKESKILLAPLRFGAGIKGKLLDAMVAGLPSITTTIGAEGIAIEENWPGFLTENNQDFIKKSFELYQDENNWKLKQEKGFQIIQQHFNKAEFEEGFFQQLEEIQKNLENHRQQNFFGAILQHSSLQSTKYLSLYIEAKNRLKNNDV